MEKSIENQLAQKPESILKNKNFVLIFIGRMISDIGDVIYNLAVAWYILSTTKSALAMSVFMAVGTVAYVIIAPIGGVIADRVDRKKLIVFMDMIRGIMVALIAILMYFNITSIWLFYITASALSICGAFFAPAAGAMIPKIVKKEQLAKANSFASMSGSISNLTGVAAAGLLYALIGICGVFVINASSFIICGLLMMIIKIEKSEFPKKASLKGAMIMHIFEDMKEGFLYLLSKKAIFIMLCFLVVLNFLLVPVFTVFIPYIFNVILSTSVKTYSIAQAFMTVGTLVGAVIMGNLRQKEKVYGIFRNTMVSVGIILLFIAVTLFLYATGVITKEVYVVIIIIQMFLCGAVISAVFIPFSVVVQKSISDEFMGRVSSIVSIMPMLAMPFGMLVGGRISDIFPMKYILIILTIFYITVTVAFTKIKALKEL